MNKYFLAIPLLLTTCLARAQEMAEGPLAETVSLVWVAIFGILFVGMIVGFFVYLWWLERKKKENA